MKLETLTAKFAAPPMKELTTQKFVKLEYSKIVLLSGKEVLTILDDPAFRHKWDILYKNCSWGTVFQSRPFIATWYQSYHQDFLPILVLEYCNERLTGLLAMAREKSGKIIGAGASQAEYQVWLSADTDGQQFFIRALEKLREQFPGSNIILKYIPGKVNLHWIQLDSTWKNRAVLRCSRHPLMKINDESISAELRKKNRREKINRLKRLGELKFERIYSYEDFAEIIDELALQSDFRKGAMFNYTIFQDDPHRKQFFLELFKQKILHTTLLKLGDKIIASNVGMQGKNWVHLQGINTHSPLYAKYSPGILHFLFLGKQLSSEKTEVFDLTPGADTYKEALATDYEIAYTLSIGNTFHRHFQNIKSAILNFVKAGSSRIGISQGALKNLKKRNLLLKQKINHARQQGISYLFESLMNGVHGKKVKSFSFSSEELPGSTKMLVITKDNLADLLRFEQHKGTKITKWEFLSNSLKNFEAGEHCYTWSENKNLYACVWVKAVDEEECVTLHSTYFKDGANKYFFDFLKHVVSDISASLGNRKFKIAVTDKNMCSALEAAIIPFE